MPLLEVEKLKIIPTGSTVKVGLKPAKDQEDNRRVGQVRGHQAFEEPLSYHVYFADRKNSEPRDAYFSEAEVEEVR